MVTRRNLQRTHEHAVLAAFTDLYSRQGKNLNVVSMPDPPDAIVTIDQRTTWIEITDAFFSREVARSITSHASSDMNHFPSDGGLVLSPEAQCSQAIQDVISKKLGKKTLRNHASSNGKGILIVGLNGPFFDIASAYNDLPLSFKDELKVQTMFSEIYFYEPHGQSFERIT